MPLSSIKIQQHSVIEYVEGLSDDELRRQIERLEGDCAGLPLRTKPH